MSGFGWAALALLFGYLAFFFCAQGRTSWRVVAATGQTGNFVSGGLFQFSCNPTFLAPILFPLFGRRSEEAALRHTLWSDADRCAAAVPRWIGYRQRDMP